jgi:large subunit ribosomal protein L21
VLEQGRGEKLIVFKYKSKSNYRRKTGHRQNLTRIRVAEIVAG